jgi:C1A family cysteine protease
MTDQQRIAKLEEQIKMLMNRLHIQVAPVSNVTNKPVTPVQPNKPNPQPPSTNDINSALNKRLYGFRPDLPDQRDYKFELLQLKPALPASIDLRSTCSPVKDQGRLGSCTANALASALEFLEIKNKLPDVFMSRLFIYYNERVLENTVTSDSGASLRDGIKTLSKQGCCPETEWPYIISRFRTRPINPCYTHAVKHVAQSYYRISTLNDMKTCLASGYPFVFGFVVYSSFESNTVATTGIAPMPSPKEKVLGGHAVLAVGYDNATQRFLIKNSWGTSWGVKGYFYLPYAYMTNPYLAGDMWYVSKAKGL